MDDTLTPTASPDARRDRGRCQGRVEPTGTSSTATVAFLALGSLGDSLPLCALAAALPGQCLERGDRSPKRCKTQAPSRETTSSGGEDPQRFWYQSHARARGQEASHRDVSCAVVTHRSHCELLRGMRQMDAD